MAETKMIKCEKLPKNVWQSKIVEILSFFFFAQLNSICESITSTPRFQRGLGSLRFAM